jgi:cytochrome c biogenesis protein CcmG, thiol:disulfide interchange protein DsbE
MTAEPTNARPRNGGRTIVVGVLVVVVVLGAVAASVTLTRADDSAVAGAPGDLPQPSLQERPDPDQQFPLPDATLKGFAGGKAVALSSFRGEPLVINFWATWCAPCVKEMPDFQTVAREAGSKVTFLGIDVMDAPSNAEKFVADLGVSYPLAVDVDGSYWKQVRSFGMPTTLFVRPDGTVVYRRTGPLTADELREALATHLDMSI